MKKFIIGFSIFISLFFAMCGVSSASPEKTVALPDSGLAKSELIDSANTTGRKDLKNTVRYNMTNTLLFGIKTMIFGYERTMGKHQSICIDIGQLSLPRISLGIDVNDSIVQSTKTTRETGYHISAEYRFYLKNENRHNSPRGVYLAPYYSYNFFERINTWTLKSSLFQGDVSTDFKLTMHTLGGELGYQFILWRRMAIDLVLIGPGITRYSINTSLSTTIDPDDKAILFEKINDALGSKIPGYTLVIDDLEYKRTGSINTTSIGFRYMIHLGFRF